MSTSLLNLVGETGEIGATSLQVFQRIAGQTGEQSQNDNVVPKEFLYNKEELVSRIKERNLGVTSYGKHVYNDLWYLCNKNKLCVTFTPRGGCSIAFQQYLDVVGLLNDGLIYDSNWLHSYRSEVFNNSINYYDIKELIDNNYTFIKFIMNPYIRAVSVYRAQESHNLSFRKYLIELINNKIDYFSENDKYHYHPQYIDGEEKIITKYIKINENETTQIELFDGTLYTLDVNKYTSNHHGMKNDKNTMICGDLPRRVINFNLPKKYKYFYDDEIRQMVEIFYKDDIEKYGFSFDVDF